MRDSISGNEPSIVAMTRTAGMVLIAAVMAASTAWTAPPQVPREWIEPATGHRVVRLSGDDGASSFYFHQNGFTAKGDKLVVSTRRGLAVLDWKTREIEPLVEGRATGTVVGKKTRQVFYILDGAVRATHLDTGKTRVIVELPPEMRGGSGLAVNADETLLGGSFVERGQRGAPPPAQRRAGGLETRWAAHLPMRLYTVAIPDGKIKTFHPSTEWLNHVQFSPTDATLMMFCHEGPWHKVDRIWTIRTDGSELRKIHARKMDMEIAGHEFFSADGKIIWYDLQTPKGKEFWLAGRVLASGETIKYRVAREHWSVHFNASPDGKLFAGDGGGPRSVAAPGNGQWIYLFAPRDGKLEAEKLVDLSRHDYRLEPNVFFSPDGQWIVFRSNMHAATHVYAVEVRKTKDRPK